MKRRLALSISAFACAAAVAVPCAGAARTTYDAHGTIYVDGAKSFPIALLTPPPLHGTTPWGTGALDEVVSAGVNLLGAGPFGRDWAEADLDEAEAWNAAAASRGVHTWIHLRELARAAEGTPQEERLKAVVARLRDDPGLAMWKGVDEPWWSGYPVSALERSHFLLKALDPDHLSLLIQAPRGTEADLAPYSAVTDVHSVDVYPVSFRSRDPNLHAVGTWTRRLASVTPNRVVVTTLQICFSGSRDRAGSGAYVLPTPAQARYMAYDAVMNGARGLIFFGGHYPMCHGAGDAPLAWNWTYWAQVLRPLVREIGPRSRLYQALLSPGTELRVRTSDPATPAIARRVGRELWVLAARHAKGTRRVTLSGLPSRLAARGWVYREGRRMSVARGAFTDTFGRWGVHVYRFRLR